MIRRFLARLIPALAARRPDPAEHLPLHEGAEPCDRCAVAPGDSHELSCSVVPLDQYEAYMRAVFGGKR